MELQRTVIWALWSVIGPGAIWAQGPPQPPTNLKAQVSLVKSSGQKWVKHIDGKSCDSNRCSPWGCATCQGFQVEIPANAQNPKPHCWTSADTKDTKTVHEIPCGVDWAWSFFDPPSRSLGPNGEILFRTFYYNRSNIRYRLAEFTVEYWLP